MMKWRIAEKKLLFLRKTKEREESNITRKALLNYTFMGLKGLGYECKQLTDKLGLPKIRGEEMQNIRKVGDRWTVNPMDKAYMKYKTLPNSRIWMR